MTPDLQQYIETQILPSAGIVEENAPVISTLPDMLNWIESNLHVTLLITEKNLSDYLFMDNEGIINKRRTVYLNQLDFYCLDLPVLGDDQHMPHKEIINVLIMPDASVPEGTFYYCTDDEWQILRAR